MAGRKYTDFFNAYKVGSKNEAAAAMYIDEDISPKQFLLTRIEKIGWQVCGSCSYPSVLVYVCVGVGGYSTHQCLPTVPHITGYNLTCETCEIHLSCEN